MKYPNLNVPNWLILIEALKAESPFNYNIEWWDRCPFGIYLKYRNLPKVCGYYGGEDRIKEHFGDLYMEMFSGGYGPKTLPKAIAQAETILKDHLGVTELQTPRKEEPMRVEIKEAPKKKAITVEDLPRGTVFRCDGNLCIKTDTVKQDKFWVSNAVSLPNGTHMIFQGERWIPEVIVNCKFTGDVQL